MRQLSGADAGFLNMETSTQYGHVSSVVMVDPSTSGCGSVYAELRQAFDERLHLLEVYRRRLIGDPFGLDHPYWVDDPDLDLEFHLREIAIPPPGRDEQLGEQIARIVARPLDRSRPLWEWYVITGLESGQVAILTKIHHSTIDGASGVEMLQILLDTEPGRRPPDPPDLPWRPERTPTSLELLARVALHYATRPGKVLEVQRKMLRMAADLSGNPAFRQMVAASVPGARRLGLLGTSEGGEPIGLAARPAPRTPFNRAITAHRRFAFRSLSLSDAKAIRRAFDVTLNDVVMALCGGALRRYLESHDALPGASLVAMVPVSVRTGAASEWGTNRVAGVLAPLHTDRAEPAARLLAIHQSMAAAKELQRAIPATMLTDITQFAPPALAAQASRLMSRMKVADRLTPLFNVVISNVPGPRQPLYLAGSRMTHFYPVSVVSEGLGLNMTVQSYLDNLDFGFIACRELVPDVWDLCDLIEEEMDALLKVAADR